MTSSRSADNPTTIEPAEPPTGPTGLTEAEAAARVKAGEGNDYKPPTSRSYLEILRQNTYPAINLILFGVSALLLASGLVIESLLTAGPILMNLAVSVVQEGQAKRKLDQIAVLERPRAVVVRDGVEHEIDPAAIVRGDLLVAARGDQLVVDGRLVGDGTVELDESLLTGEADAIHKHAGDPVLSGTVVVSGAARYVAERVGRASTANELLTRARDVPEERTPLQREIERTIWVVAGLVALAGVAVALAHPSLPRSDPQEALRDAAVLVTLVPQGLAIMVTAAYAVGALRITRLGALVQRQGAIESMSRADTLCTDKTGTLTTQRMVVAGVEPLDPALSASALGTILGEVAVSATAPSRTTDALLAAFPGAAALPLSDEVAFASQRRWSAVRFADTASLGGLGLEPRPYIMGATDALATALDGGGDQLQARTRSIAETGGSVLLLAEAPPGSILHRGDSPALPAGLRPLGLVTFQEELRAGVERTLAQFQQAGVSLKVISGDDPTTVAAVGRRVGLPEAMGMRSGVQLAELDDDALAAAAEVSDVFGRIDPNLKARLVAALRKAGHFVAMMGDGVNDLLALRHAQVAIAMESGSQATRGAADLVLLGDRFDVLPQAVVEGQRIVAAMSASMILLLSRTFGVLLLVVAAALAGLPFPVTPRQNSAMAFVTVGVPVTLLAFWVPPRRPPKSLIGTTLRFAIPAAVGVAAVAFVAYAWSLSEGRGIDEARTTVTTMAAFCGIGLLPLIERRGEMTGRLSWAWPWVVAVAMVALYVLILEVPVARDFYELTPLPWSTIGVLVLVWAVWTLAAQALRRPVGRLEDALSRLALRLWRVKRTT